MKTFAIAALALASVVSASPVLAARTNFKANFDSQNTAATGTGAFTFDDVSRVLCGSVTYNGLAGGVLTGGALKNANNQSLVVAVAVGPSPLAINVVLTEAAGALLTQGDLYLALGNATYPANAGSNGELNGELLLDSAGVDRCPVPDAGADAAVDAATGADAGNPDSGTSSSGGPSGDTSPGESSSNEDRAPVPSEPPAESEDSGGCSTSGAASSGGALLAGFVTILLAWRSRRRRQ